MAFAQRGLPDTFVVGNAPFPRPSTRAFVGNQQPTRNTSFSGPRSVGRLSSPPTVTVSATPVAERVGNFVPPPQVSLEKKVCSCFYHSIRNDGILG